MEKREIIVLSVLFVLGLVSLGAGFRADAIRTKDIYSTSYLRIYPRRQALPLGIIAVLALFIALVIIIAETSWLYCNRSDDHPFISNRAVALICVGVSWITTFIAFFMFGVGFDVLIHPEQQNTLVSAAHWWYYILKGGVFSIGSLLSYISVNLYFFFYRDVLSAKSSNPVQAPHQRV